MSLLLLRLQLLLNIISYTRATVALHPQRLTDTLSEQPIALRLDAEQPNMLRARSAAKQQLVRVRCRSFAAVGAHGARECVRRLALMLQLCRFFVRPLAAQRSAENKRSHYLCFFALLLLLPAVFIHAKYH